MAQEQRILGGALLVVGAVVIYILISQLPEEINPQEAYTELSQTVLASYLSAEEKGDYAELRLHASRARNLIEQGGSPIEKLIRAGATSSDRRDRRLLQLVEDGSFEKNAEGLFGFQKKWFDQSIHRSLVELDEAIKKKLKILNRIRSVAKEARDAVEEARKASRLPLELPEAPPAPDEGSPILEPNPVFDYDSELYRVFGLPRDDLAKALATPSPGGSARPARLRWNRNVVPGSLSRDIEGVPELARSLNNLAGTIELNARRIAGDPNAADVLAALIRKATTQVGIGVEGEQKKAFVENRAAFEKADAVVKVLRWESKLLDAYHVPARELAKQFTVEFKLD